MVVEAVGEISFESFWNWSFARLSFDVEKWFDYEGPMRAEGTKIHASPEVSHSDHPLFLKEPTIMRFEESNSYILRIQVTIALYPGSKSSWPMHIRFYTFLVSVQPLTPRFGAAALHRWIGLEPINPGIEPERWAEPSSWDERSPVTDRLLHLVPQVVFRVGF